VRGLKPGGVLVVEGFHLDATKGASIGRSVVFETGELVRIYEKPRVVRYCGERVELKALRYPRKTLRRPLRRA
jgi:hypothetical protein